LSLVLSVGAQVSGTWRIANVQLEPGLNATVFEHRPVGVELALCQRYYYQFAKASSAFALPAQRIATTTSTLILDVPVGMRTTPTAVLGTSPFGRVYARNTAFNTVAGNITSFTVAAAISSHVYQADLGHNTVNDSLNGFTFDTLGGSAPGIGLSAEL
jgi:predicted metal-dependent enzyme (double-stranded beta helix superfamily)